MTRLYIALGLAVFVSLALFYTYRIGYNAGRDSFKVKVQEELLDKKAKMDVIRNNRPDRATVVKRLLDGSF